MAVCQTPHWKEISSNPIGPVTTLSSINAQRVGLDSFSSSEAVAVFLDGSAKEIKAVGISISGTSVSVGTPATLDTSVTDVSFGKQLDVSVTGTSPNQFMCSYLDDITTGSQARRVGAAKGQVEANLSITNTAATTIITTPSHLSQFATCLGGNDEALIHYSNGSISGQHQWTVRSWSTLSQVDSGSYSSAGNQHASGCRNRFNVGNGGLYTQADSPGGRFSFFNINGASSSLLSPRPRATNAYINGNSGIVVDFISSTKAACLYSRFTPFEFHLTTVTNTDTSPALSGTPLNLGAESTFPGTAILPEITLLDAAGSRVLVYWHAGPLPSGTATGINYIIASKDGTDSWFLDDQGMWSLPTAAINDRWDRVAATYLSDGKVLLAISRVSAIDFYVLSL